MEALYHNTNKLVLEVQNSFVKLEQATGNNVHLIENEIQAMIDQIISNCERLDLLVNKEPPTRRPTAKLRVDQIKYDCKHLQSALRNLQHKRYQKEEEERERDALLTRKFAPNNVSGETSIYIDAEIHQHQRMKDANRNMDDMIDGGSGVLRNLREQRATFKGAHKRILDVANTLGLSNTVLRLIEKRTYQDKFVLFGGMIFTCVIMFLVWKYLI